MSSGSGVQPSSAPRRTGSVTKAGTGFVEFIILVALLNSVVALAIDIMLPALPQIGEGLGVGDHNDRQMVVVVFGLGFGLSQIVFGPFSDRFGRRTVLIPAMAFYTVFSLAAIWTESYAALLAMRAAQGACAAAVRVVTTAIVRDCFTGREMSRVMSYSYSIFMVVPIVAPGIGQAILVVAPWQWIFAFLGVFGAALGVWTFVRLKETLPEDERRPISYAAVSQAFGEIASNRISVGYTIAAMLCFGGLYAYIVSSQQVFDVVFDKAAWFATAFGATACLMAIFSLLNGQLVRRLGMRMISHWALIAYAVAATLLVAISMQDNTPFWPSFLLMAMIMGAFGVVSANFNAIAMEPMGRIAGSASSLIGVVTFTGGAALGAVVGRFFDGTLVPLALGFAIFGYLSILVVVWTDRGRLFRRSAGD